MHSCQWVASPTIHLPHLFHNNAYNMKDQKYQLFLLCDVAALKNTHRTNNISNENSLGFLLQNIWTAMKRFAAAKSVVQTHRSTDAPDTNIYTLGPEFVEALQRALLQDSHSSRAKCSLMTAEPGPDRGVPLTCGHFGGRQLHVLTEVQKRGTLRRSQCGTVSRRLEKQRTDLHCSSTSVWRIYQRRSALIFGC